VFDLLKEYDIIDMNFEKKYTHPAVVWYQKRHIARLDGLEHEFHMQQPPKDWSERYEMTKKSLKDT